MERITMIKPWEGGCLPFKASTGWYIVTKYERWLIEDENS